MPDCSPVKSNRQIRVYIMWGEHDAGSLLFDWNFKTMSFRPYEIDKRIECVYRLPSLPV